MLKPTILYKYVPFTRIDILQDRRICHSTTAQLNDPFDMRPTFRNFCDREFAFKVLNQMIDKEIDGAVELMAKLVQRISDVLKSAGLDPQEIFTHDPQEFVASSIEGYRHENATKLEQLLEAGLLGTMTTELPETLDKFFGQLEARYGILCLSETKESLLMWAHYADNHRGFVIGISPQAFTNARGPNRRILTGKPAKVKYHTKRPANEYLVKLDGQALLLRKGIEWKYEREWRIIRFLENANYIAANEYHLFDIPSQAILSVSLGCRIKPGDRQTIISLIRTSPKLAHVSIDQAKVDDKEFQLNFVPV